MLRIRNEQMRAILRPMRAPFVEKLMAGFREIWPAKAAQLGPRYCEFIEFSVERAASYGILKESGIARFVNLDFVWGAEFEKDSAHEWALRILKNPRMSEVGKINELATQTKLRLMAIQSGMGKQA